MSSDRTPAAEAAFYHSARFCGESRRLRGLKFAKNELPQVGSEKLSSKSTGETFMNKRLLVEAIAADTDVDLTTAEAVLNATVGAISTALAEGDKVAIPGFGTFETRARAARTGRNPQTGDTIQIAASVTPAFKPATALKQAVSAN
ncbi:MAG: HU family DNA-binding protein [Actinomycetota bacterium]